MKKFSLLILLLLGSLSIAVAQRTVTGNISDSEGVPIIGANVLVSGLTVGTVTDIDGNFSIDVPANANSLVVSYVGYTEQIVDITGQSVINITLSEGQLLDEVVVTALGIERNARNVAYANQTVSADELLSAPSKNALEALRGKAAGVKISTASGSVGASSRIVLRGEASITGDNNALIVIDGIPIDNSASRGGSGSASTGFVDYGNRFNDINPDDIASISILKGPAATAAYGSRGSSGVLVITTKKGADGKDKFSVTVNSTNSVERAYVLFQRQDKFGQGYDGAVFDSGENWSWGPAFDGVVRPWTTPIDSDGDGDLEFLSRPYSAVPNQLENFFRRGSTNTQSVSFAGSSDKFSYRASYNNQNQNGILDNTSYGRNSFSLSASAKVSERFKTDFSILYSLVNLDGASEGSRGFDGNNAYAAVIQTPVNIPIHELRDYKSPFHNQQGYYAAYTGNPYFNLYEFTNNGKINNFLATMSGTFNITKGLDFIGKFGTNSVNTRLTTITPAFDYGDALFWTNNLELGVHTGRANNPGEYNLFTNNNVNNNYNAQLVYNTSLFTKFNLSTTAGYDMFTRTGRGQTASSIGGFIVPGWYSLNNSKEPVRYSPDNDPDYRINGVYGNINLGWDNKIFLDYSARNDWSSSLPIASNSFFYQAVGLSAVVSDLLNLQDNKVMDYLKLRMNFGTTGKDAPTGRLNSSFIGNGELQNLANGHSLNFPLNGQPGFTVGNFIGNPNLKPELTTSIEFGVDANLFNDIFQVEYTYYNANATDQIVDVNLPSSTGYATTTVNIGKMNNKGHELGVTIRPLGSKSKVSWESNITFAKNFNKVIKISDQQNELSITSVSGVSIVAREGYPFGTFKAPVEAKNANGDWIIGDNGQPVIAQDEAYLGSYQPDFIAGFNNSIGFKGFKFNFLLDIRQGGSFFSSTRNLGNFNGTTVTTLLNNREPYVIPGVLADGTPNTKTVGTYDYYNTELDYHNLIDASFVKLRELGLTYTLPTSISKRVKSSGITIGLFGKNLKFWLPEENTFADPEVNGPALTGNGGGIETSQTPPSRSFGFNVSVKF
ncbi:MAG: SusC/RagA family TonB-linked outer membrane protein [Saprospiraceae bacterium]|nr:SusC/RagA family TonB-linked outer membrane protein [Saprospiraceae bacterium]